MRQEEKDKTVSIVSRRLEVLRQVVQGAGLQGLVIHEPVYIAYYTGWLPSPGEVAMLVFGAGDLLLLAPSMPVTISPPWHKVITFGTEKGDVSRALEQGIAQLGLMDQTVGAALGTLPAIYVLPLLRRIHLRDARSLLFQATVIKDDVALLAIRQRIAMLACGFQAAAAAIQPGNNELSVFSAISAAIVQSLRAPVKLDCNLASGPRTLDREPQATSRTLRRGDIVLIDLFPQLGSYSADYARNFVAGPPTAGQQAQHTALEKTLAAAEAALRPGVLASEIDRICRATIESQGFGPYIYQHHSGHGLGLLSNEPPWIIPENDTPLRAGMVVAIEPGIYHPINGGMRLEGNYLVTEEGCEALVSYPAKLVSCDGW